MDNLIYLLIGISAVNFILLIVVLARSGKGSEKQLSQLERNVNAELRDDLDGFRAAIEQRFDVMRSDNRAQLNAVLQRSDKLNETIYKSLEDVRHNTSESLDKVRSENLSAMNRLSETLSRNMESLRKENGDQLERMRKTVDEQLHETLETRLTQSFAEVTKQLEAVYKGLGEMQNLAKSVGDLSRIFTNVKSRGVWGEVQVRSILDEILTADQYEMNFHPRPRSAEVVEFAIKLPGKDSGENVYLPIDSKFPREDYENYLKAQENGDAEGLRFYQNAMRNRVLSEAKDIRDKYINPPRTTDFAVLFLPTESLYAEILSIPGFAEQLQNEYRVTVSGPTTLSALVNSLQMGFRTLAVEKRSHEVWKLFAQMRKQFGYFATSLEAAEKSVNQAVGRIGEVSRRSEKIGQKLESIQLPEGDDTPLLEDNA